MVSGQRLNLELLIALVYIGANTHLEILPRRDPDRALILYPIGYWVVLLYVSPWLAAPLLLVVQGFRAVQLGGRPTAVLANITVHVPAMMLYMVALRQVGETDLRLAIPGLVVVSAVGAVLTVVAACLVYPYSDLRSAFTLKQVAAAIGIYLFTSWIWVAWPPILFEDESRNVEFAVLAVVSVIHWVGVALAWQWERRHGYELTPMDTRFRFLRRWRSQFRLGWSVLGLVTLQRRTARRHLARFRALTDLMAQSTDGFATMAADGTISSWNRTLELWSGVDGESAVGTPLPDLLPQVEGHFDWTTTGADGVERTIAVHVMSLQPAVDNAAAQMGLVLGKDVTEHVRRDMARNQYVSMVSHELTSPLMAMTLGAEMAREDTVDPNVREALDDVLEAGEHLESVVADLDVTARVVTLGVDGLPFTEGTSTLNELFASGTPKAFLRDPRVTVHSENADTRVRCDQLRARQVLSSLLSNASKYAPPPTPIDIFYGVSGGFATITVADRGAGVSADDRERIFQKFVRGANVDSARGAGIGLAVARALAEAMDGTLEYHDRPGGGAMFVLSLKQA